MPPEEFEPAIVASERPQTLALDRADTEIGFTYSRYGKLDNVSETHRMWSNRR
jgi:hypothetical protein